MAPVSRRDFIVTGGALLAGTTLPAWADVFPQGQATDDARAEAAEAALKQATAGGASYADVRVNRYRRESIATRERQIQNVSRSMSYGLGIRVLVDGAWGFAATNRVEPAAARAAAEQAVAIARANARLATRKIVLADADKVVTNWTSAFKRDPFEVGLEDKTAFLMKLNEAALAVPGVSFVTSQVLFVDEHKYFASTEGSRITQRLVRTYPQFSTTAADRSTGDFQSRPVVDRAQLLGYEYVQDYPWIADAEKAGHEVVEKLKAKPVSAGRYDIVVDPSQLFLCIHESVGHSTELDRALGWEANMAGTSFIKPADAGKLRFGSKIVNLVGDRTQPGGLATTGYDDEGVKSERWHIVREGMFVDWQTTRELAPLVGQTAIARLPARRRLVERAVPAHAERLARAGGDGCVARRAVQRHQARSLHRRTRCLVDRPAALQLPVRRGGDPRDHQWKAWRDGERRGLPITYARLLGVVRRHWRPLHVSAVGHVGRRKGRARTDQRRESRVSAGAVPPGHGPQHGGAVMLTRDEALGICETVLAAAKTAGAEDAAITVNGSAESHARFADNRITTSGHAENVDITATVWVERRRGAVSGNDASPDALKRMAAEAVQIARVSPVHREYLPTLGPIEYPKNRAALPRPRRASISRVARRPWRPHSRHAAARRSRAPASMSQPRRPARPRPRTAIAATSGPVKAVSA